MADPVVVTSVDQAGDIGGNGVSRWYWMGAEGAEPSSADVDTVAAAVHSFYNGINQFLPPDMTWTVQPEVSVINQESGKLESLLSGSVGLQPIKGLSSSANYPAGIGARVNWQTGIVLNRKRVRGATFIAPLSGNAYGSQGSIIGAVQSLLVGAAGSYNSALQNAGFAQVVYHRPAKGATTGGVACMVQAWTVGTTPSRLRSRQV